MRSNRIAVILTVLSYVLSIAAIFYLPDQVAIHWNAEGEVDGYSSKWFGAFLSPVLITAVVILMNVMPKMDPKRKNYESFKGSYQVILVVLVLFFFALHVVTLAYNLGFPVDINLFVPLGIGLLFIVLGNYMPKMKPNYFIGIRTPWTLANETVWNKTHRLGGKVFVLLGMILTMTVFIEGAWRFFTFIIAVMAGVLYLVIQSYLYFRKEQSGH